LFKDIGFGEKINGVARSGFENTDEANNRVNMTEYQLEN
jgi:hypothetical protein